MDEWINDTTWECQDCPQTFKVYVKDNEPSVQFCPTCGSGDLEEVEEDSEETEI